MFKRLLFVTRRPDLTHEEFRRYYEQVHVPLVTSLRPVQPLIYRRNYLAPGRDPNAQSHMEGRDPGKTISFDCVTEIVFANRRDAAPPPPGIVEQLRRDEENFIAPDGLSIHVVEVAEEF